MGTSFSKFLIILSIGLFFSTAAFSQLSNQVNRQVDNQILQSISQEDIQNIEVGVEGYDVVNYFYSTIPQKGTTNYQAVYKGKRYLFTSAENQVKFSSSPDYYLPEFEEYCGCAVSDNERKKADPKVFKISKGKLILFQDEEARNKWNENEEGRHKQARNFFKYENEYDASERLHDDTRVRLFSF